MPQYGRALYSTIAFWADKFAQNYGNGNCGVPPQHCTRWECYQDSAVVQCNVSLVLILGGMTTLTKHLDPESMVVASMYGSLQKCGVPVVSYGLSHL